MFRKLKMSKLNKNKRERFAVRVVKRARHKKNSESP